MSTSSEVKIKILDGRAVERWCDRVASLQRGYLRDAAFSARRAVVPTLSAVALAVVSCVASIANLFLHGFASTMALGVAVTAMSLAFVGRALQAKHAERAARLLGLAAGHAEAVAAMLAGKGRN